MATAHFVKKARKDNPEHDIKKGDSYWWWSMFNGRFGIKHYSKTQPKRSQLTGSSFYATMYDIEDSIAEAVANSDLEQFVADIAQQLHDAADECQSSFDNMPEGLQQGDTGQLLEQRVEACNNAADEFEGLDMNYDADSFDGEEGETAEDKEQRFWDEKLEEVQNVDLSYE